MNKKKTDNICSCKMVMRDGTLVFTSGNQALYNNFTSNLIEGQTVLVFYEANNDDGTNDQLAKIHVIIRKIALQSGNTFNEIKLIVKERTGFLYHDFEKSFGDGSREELTLVLEELKVICQALGISFV